jgi:hypothetical protein
MSGGGLLILLVSLLIDAHLPAITASIFTISADTTELFIMTGLLLEERFWHGGGEFRMILYL